MLYVNDYCVKQQCLKKKKLFPGEECNSVALYHCFI